MSSAAPRGAVDDLSPLSPAQEQQELASSSKKGCCHWITFDNYATARGYFVHGVARGPIYMANIFLSAALIYLASEQVGCLDVIDETTGQAVVAKDCDKQVFGVFKPASLVTNIATISGVMIAFFMPFLGAILDSTSHRWTVGVGSAVFLLLILGIQIATTIQTWFAMAILQTIAALFFQIQILSSMAYLPDIAREVGEETMNTYVAYFLICENGNEVLFALAVVILSTLLGLGDVPTAQLGQALCTVWCSWGFFVAWKRFPKVPPRHVPPDRNDKDDNQEDTTETNATANTPSRQGNILLRGLIQNLNTCKRINRDYKHSLRWFLLATVFADAAANAYMTVAVIFLTEHLGMNVTEVGLFFVVVLVALIAACRPAEIITAWTNPNISWRLAMMFEFVVTVIGALTLTRENVKPLGYVWGCVVGLGMGWYYQTMYIYMSLVVPKDQEAEISGFFSYCRVILAWLPPLLFSLLVEANVSQSIGVIVTVLFFWVAIGLLSLSAPWDAVIEEVNKSKPVEDTTREQDSLQVEVEDPSDRPASLLQT